jgi:hypothetical protein
VVTASASRPARRGSTVYRSATRVIKYADTSFVVYADPIPLHAARVYQRGRGAHWTVEFHTVFPSRKWAYESMESALNAASDLVGRKAGQEWSERFTGPQRYVMGQQKCPRIMSGGKTCDQAAAPGTVWCEWHPNGKEVE